MRSGVALTVLSIATAIVAPLRFLPSEGTPAGTSPAQPLRVERLMTAQGGRGARDDGAAARSDALMGTPNKKTPVPQDNLFSTSPRLEQQVPRPEGAAPSKDTRDATPAPAAAPR